MGALTGLMAVVLFLGLPIIIVIAAVYFISKNRQMAHAERMKMIENGLITDPSDFEQMSKSIKTSDSLDKFSLIFYPLLVFLGLIFITYFIYMLFFLVFLKTGENTGTFLIWSLIGIVLTTLFAVFIKIYHKFQPYRYLLIAGCFFLSLMWSVFLINHIKDLSIDRVKTSIKQNLELGAGIFDEVGDIEIEVHKPCTEDSLKTEGKVIIR